MDRRLATFACWLLSAAAANGSESEEIRAVTRGALEATATPGMAVCAVKDGVVILAQGFGHRHLTDRALVDSKTLFPVASIAKTFAAASVCMLVSSGDLSWDTSIGGVVKAWSPVAPRTTVRDLLRHSVGLERGDQLWAVFDYRLDEILTRMRGLSSAGTEFAYSNLNYLVIGEAVKQVSGVPWATFADRRIFSPLGITRLARSGENKNVAVEHNWSMEQQGLVPLQKSQVSILPAASLSLSIEDMAKWLLLHIKRGELGGVRLWDATTGAEMYRQQLKIPAMSRGRRPFSGAGLGWFVGTYGDVRLVGSHGVTQGAQAFVYFVPEKRIGFALLTNSRGNAHHSTLAFRILDILLGRPAIATRGHGLGPRIDWNEFVEILPARKSPIPNAAYQGVYLNPTYGRIEVDTKLSGELTVKFGVHPPRVLKLFRHTAFEVVESNPVIRLVFGFKAIGLVARVSVEAVGQVTMFDRNRKETSKLRARRTPTRVSSEKK